MAHDLHDCNQTIINMCSPHANVTDEEKETLETCKGIMHAFKDESDQCQVTQ